jgi:hypothetical protein
MIVSQNCYITASEQKWNIAHSLQNEYFDEPTLLYLFLRVVILQSVIAICFYSESICMVL